jgi:small GTP-binding protein
MAEYREKIVLVGEASVGKTSTQVQYIEGKFSDRSTTTVGCDFQSKKTSGSDGTPVKVQVWDTAGQENLRTVTPKHYKAGPDGTSPVGIIVVYDVTNRKQSYGKRGEKVEDWITEIRSHNPNVVICIAGNKLDLVEKGIADRQVTEEEVKDLADRIKVELYFQISAKTGHNINSMFQAVIDKVLSLTIAAEASEAEQRRLCSLRSEANEARHEIAFISVPADKVKQAYHGDKATHSFTIQMSYNGKNVEREKQYHELREFCIRLQLSPIWFFADYREAPFPRRTVFSCEGNRLEQRRERLDGWLRHVFQDARAQDSGSDFSRTLRTFFELT